MALNVQTTILNSFSCTKTVSLTFSQGSINNNTPLVQVMAWRRTGDRPLPEILIDWFSDVDASLSLAGINSQTTTKWKQSDNISILK